MDTSVSAQVAGSIRSRRVIDVLSTVVSEHDATTDPRSDNGPEFVSQAVIRWRFGGDNETAAIDPGKP